MIKGGNLAPFRRRALFKIASPLHKFYGYHAYFDKLAMFSENKPTRVRYLNLVISRKYYKNTFEGLCNNTTVQICTVDSEVITSFCSCRARKSGSRNLLLAILQTSIVMDIAIILNIYFSNIFWEYLFSKMVSFTEQLCFASKIILGIQIHKSWELHYFTSSTSRHTHSVFWFII